MLIALVFISIFIYIWASTTFINEMDYRSYAYALSNYSENILNWENAKVTLVKLETEPCITPNIISMKINRYLLFLNGGYAVKVEMRTNMDELLGPLIIYFNPFTRQYIGGAPRL